jgi:steroid delta-isomerase-like uncharacterized protein
MLHSLPDAVAHYLEAYNARDVDAMLRTFTEDVIFEHVSNSTESVRTEGRADLERLARQTAALFTSRQQTVTEVIREGARLALMIDYRATVAIDLPNGWKQGQQLRLRGVSFFELRDERICRVVDFV